MQAEDEGLIEYISPTANTICTYMVVNIMQRDKGVLNQAAGAQDEAKAPLRMRSGDWWQHYEYRMAAPNKRSIYIKMKVGVSIWIGARQHSM